MKITRRGGILVSLLLLSCLLINGPVVRAGEEVTLSEVYDEHGEQIHAISLEKANAMATWDPAKQEPPLSVAKSILAAKKWLATKGIGEEAKLADIDIKIPVTGFPGMENKWYYILMFYTPAQFPAQPFPRALRVVVLMDGTVVDAETR